MHRSRRQSAATRSTWIASPVWITTACVASPITWQLVASRPGPTITADPVDVPRGLLAYSWNTVRAASGTRSYSASDDSEPSSAAYAALSAIDSAAIRVRSGNSLLDRFM